MRNLILAFDGTWDEPDHDLSDGNQNTHVARLVSALNHTDSPIDQRVFYQPGVGTDLFDQIRGGIFGWGLSDKIIDAYVWLIDHFQKGDRIFLVGYSRGAFAARSLSGLLDRVGLLSLKHRHQVNKAYALYRRGNVRTQHAFRERYSIQVSIEAIAVWDTVGALGIPLRSFHGINHHLWSFHDTRLAPSVKSGFHAIAIDEHRPDFKPTLWSPQKDDRQHVEQRWFAGSHADIGGGGSNPLSDISFDWICESLLQKGMHIDLSVKPLSVLQFSKDALPTDSFTLFLGGMYDWFRDRHYRPIGFTVKGYESIDDSVFKLMREGHYHPLNEIGTQIDTTPSQYSAQSGQSLVRLCDLIACQTPDQKAILTG